MRYFKGQGCSRWTITDGFGERYAPNAAIGVSKVAALSFDALTAINRNRRFVTIPTNPIDELDKES